MILLTLGSCLQSGQTVLAQDNDDIVVENVLEEVIVTGTRITRRDFTSSSPLVTISKDDFDFSGQPTLEEHLNQMPQLQPSDGRARNNGSDGTAALDLRGLGPGRTLVMLNGRRVAPSGVGSAIDVNNIPSVLVERVEIITGGASTVYGSDAIAGVINFITRNDFEGLSLEGGYSITAEGDADIWDANVVYGHRFDNGGNITAYAGRYERESLYADQREFTAKVVAMDFFDATFYDGGSGSIPAGRISNPRVNLGSGPGQITFNPDGTPRYYRNREDLYNFEPVNYIQTPLSRDTVGVLGQVPLSAGHEAYFELSWARNQATLSLAEIPFGGFVTVNLDNPVLAPETRAMLSLPQFGVETEPGSGMIVPGIAGMFFLRRMTELGPRIIDHDRTYQRYLVGVRGELAGDWMFDAWLTLTDADENERLFNDGSRSRLQQGLLVDPVTGQCFDPSGGCVPIDIFGAGKLSPEAAAFLRVDDVANTTQRKQTLAALVVTGTPFEIWTGPVDVALGAEWRRDEAQFEADELLFTGDTIGFRGTAPIDGSESVYELYAETVLTLFEATDSDRQLDLEAGVRWSNYDNAGTTTTWKAGLQWQATDTIGFRTMFQHAVRAPNNAELFTAQGTELNSYVGSESRFDPCSASADPVGNGNTDKCVLQGLPASQVGVFEAQPFYPTSFIFGGNPDLVPEASDTFTVGTVIQPAFAPDLLLSLDYWDLEVEDTIGDIDVSFVCFDPLNTAGLFCDTIQRDATGNVSQVTGLIQNRGLLATNGVDMQVQYRHDLPAGLAVSGDFAQLSVNAVLSHVISLESQENPVTDVIECAGWFGFFCGGVVPENRLLANFNYTSGPFTAQLSWRWIDDAKSDFKDALEYFGFTGVNLALDGVSSTNYFDLGLGWNWDDRLGVRFGVNNLFDQGPPLMADAGPDHNTDPVMYDLYGRTYFMNMTFQATGH